MTKQAKAALIRMVEVGFADLGVPLDRLRPIVADVVVQGSPPRVVEVYATVHFLESGQPFCCGELGCYAEVLHNELMMADFLRRRMHLKVAPSVRYHMKASYPEGLQFTWHRD